MKKKASAPIIWLLGLEENDKDIAKQIIKTFKEAGVAFSTVDFGENKHDDRIHISIITYNMTAEQGKPYYDYVRKKLTSLRLVVS